MQTHFVNHFYSGHRGNMQTPSFHPPKASEIVRPQFETSVTDSSRHVATQGAGHYLATVCSDTWLGHAVAEQHLISLVEFLLGSPDFDTRMTATDTWAKRELAREIVERFKRTRYTMQAANESVLCGVLMQIAQNACHEFHLCNHGPACNPVQPHRLKPATRTSHQKHGLSQIHMQILDLYESNQLSYSQIAERLNLKIGTVKSRLNRARKARKQLRMTKSA